MPAKTSPRKRICQGPIPPPFNNFGHQLLLDYKLLVDIVWQIVADIQLTLEKVPKSNSTAIALGIVATIVTAILILSVEPEAFWLALGAGFVGYLTGNSVDQYSRQKQLRKEVAYIRAQALEKLISGNWRLEYKPETEKNKELDHLVGNGTLEGDKNPVLIVLNEQHPFPGYGRLQAESLFVCRPQKNNSESISTSTTIGQIREAISEKIVETVSRYETKEVSFGNVIVIHGNSIAIDSPWLDQNKVPPLWLNKDKFEDVESIDKKASVRTYFATQVMFPQYMTTATFFIRAFMAGNAASCQIAVTTLGPLVFGIDYFNKRLLRSRMEMDGTIEKVTKKLTTKKLTTKDTTSSASLEQLRLVGLIGQAGDDFQSHVYEFDIKRLNISEKETEDYSKEFKEAIKESIRWPGFLLARQNLRELNSLTFTDDFFGKSEAIASVKTLYDQIARTLLDTLDTLGFDISAYRDKEGNYSINADKIDQLVLGERIQITHLKEVEKTEAEQPTPA
ncbi:MAG: hypothetical protein HC875_28475 [Anaerolineales bacterium]|nr:hypothetical protein [Anaerolineales bacterium]